MRAQSNYGTRRARNAGLVGLIACISLTACTSLLTGASGPSAGRPIGKEGRSATTVSSDTEITKRIQARFAADPDLSDSGILVQTRSGVVTLSGSTGSFDNRERAMRLAGDVSGVARVYNRISVRTR